MKMDVLRNLASGLIGLEKQCIHHVDTIPDGPALFAQRHADTLRYASYRFGMNDLSPKELENLSKAVPKLQGIGFNWEAASSPLIEGTIHPEFQQFSEDIAVSKDNPYSGSILIWHSKPFRLRKIFGLSHSSLSHSGRTEGEIRLKKILNC